MVLHPTTATEPRKTVSPRHALLENLIAIVGQHLNDQILGLAGRLSAGLLDVSDMAIDAKEVHQRFKAGNLLKKNSHAFLQMTATAIDRAVRKEIAQLAPQPQQRPGGGDGSGPMSLVPYEEMDSRVTFGLVGKPFDLQYAEPLATLNVRLAYLLDRDILRMGQNPFRPEVFLIAVQKAWCEFEADADSNNLLLPLLTPALFLDLAPMLEALNQALMRKGILPGSVDGYKGRKDNQSSAAKLLRAPPNQAVLSQQLRQFFSSATADELSAPSQFDGLGDEFDLTLPNLPQAGGLHGLPNLSRMPPGSAWQQGGNQGARGAVQNELMQKLSQVAAKQPLLSYLASLQHRAPARDFTAPGVREAAAAMHLNRIKEEAPKGSLSRTDETTIDLLSTIFDTVFKDDNISHEIRDLIRLLQIPVLKAALIDKEFFFQEEHPARRLIDTLSRQGWEQRKGPEDPLFRAMQRSVDKVEREFDQELSVFSEAVHELEASIQAEEQAAASAISEPIATALKQEKMAQATRSAKAAIALRVNTGEVQTVIETFLENRWISVLTVAYSVEDEKPGAVNNATRTMEDLIWSVKPKVSMDERKQLIGKLPALLSALNKWLDIVKWQDADRLQFFAELAECHASIVRAPIELTPERQVEISVEVAQQAAERRLERQSQMSEAAPEPEPDEAVDAVGALQRGMWMEFDQPDGTLHKVKLAWISPLRTLFIFSTGARQEAFSLTGEVLAQRFRDNQVEVISNDGVVARALSQAMEEVAVSDEAADAHNAYA